MSPLHSASRLSLGCLAATDLGVGLVIQPIRIALFMSPQHSKLSSYLLRISFETTRAKFCAVSLLATTTISVDRLLALMLGLRYRQVVTLRRATVFVATLWLFTVAMVLVAFYNFHIAINIASIVLLIVYCNINFLLHEDLSHTSPSPNSSARTSLPKTTG